MKTFDMPPSQRLKLIKATPRKEVHGKALIQAISLSFEWWPEDNASVNLVHENLQDLIFWTPPEVAAQCEHEGIPFVKKHRRVTTLKMPLVVEVSFTGYVLVIEHGIDETSALELYACTLDKFTVDAKEGGSAPIRFSVGSNKQVTPQLVGILCGLEGTNVVATLRPPTVEEAIDGSKAGGGPGFRTTDAAKTPGQDHLLGDDAGDGDDDGDGADDAGEDPDDDGGDGDGDGDGGPADSDTDAGAGGDAGDDPGQAGDDPAPPPVSGRRRRRVDAPGSFE